MGRRLGSKNKPKDGNGSGPTVTAHDNVAREPLTDEQQHALTADWAEKYDDKEREYKRIGAELKNIARAAKAEKVLLADIRAYLKAETEEGQLELQKDAERIERIARWRGFPVGHQFGMFEEGEGAESRSFILGKEAGLAGKTAIVPDNCDHDQWMQGWHAGQAILMSGFKTAEAPGADEFN